MTGDRKDLCAKSPSRCEATICFHAWVTIHPARFLIRHRRFLRSSFVSSVRRRPGNFVDGYRLRSSRPICSIVKRQFDGVCFFRLFRTLGTAHSVPLKRQIAEPCVCCPTIPNGWGSVSADRRNRRCECETGRCDRSRPIFQDTALIAERHLEARKRPPIEAVVAFPGDRNGSFRRAQPTGRCAKVIHVDLAEPCLAANAE